MKNFIKIIFIILVFDIYLLAEPIVLLSEESKAKQKSLNLKKAIEESKLKEKKEIAKAQKANESTPWWLSNDTKMTTTSLVPSQSLKSVKIQDSRKKLVSVEKQIIIDKQNAILQAKKDKERKLKKEKISKNFVKKEILQKVNQVKVEIARSKDIKFKNTQTKKSDAPVSLDDEFFDSLGNSNSNSIEME